MNNPSKRHKFIRLTEWDYRSQGYYFVTICTHARRNLFSDERLYEIAAQAWLYIPQQPHAQNARLDEWVIMPNHLHGLVVITEEPNTPLPTMKRPNNAPPNSLATIIGNYKSLVSKRIHAIWKGSKEPVWQPGYYERIVRNERELNAIRQYIRDNPTRWADDKDNLDKLLAKMQHTNIS